MHPKLIRIGIKDIQLPRCLGGSLVIRLGLCGNGMLWSLLATFLKVSVSWLLAIESLRVEPDTCFYSLKFLREILHCSFSKSPKPPTPHFSHAVAPQIQMQSNELLREILGVSKWGGTGEEKPFYSKSSGVRKQQTTSRTRSRHSKQVAQDQILSDTELR